MMKKTVLYVHGMGGGSDSRIPRYLNERLSACGSNGTEVAVVCRTYDFDPSLSSIQLDSWMEELHPDLIIGESLGACLALRLTGVPHILVSPALNGPRLLGALSFISLIPGMPRLLKAHFTKADGNRQVMDFRFRILRHYRGLRPQALRSAKADPHPLHAFFGVHDHYRKRGVVSLNGWRRHFGKETMTVFDGTHYMEEEYIDSLLIPRIRLFLGINPPAGA